MNGFVNSLLELILSWMRGIISDVWTMLSGDTGSIFSWLGRHWLSLACILIIGGITADLVFYILRWHPQRVWFAKIDRLFHRAVYAEEELAFEAGYDSGIDSFSLEEEPLISQYLNSPHQPPLSQYEAAIVPPSQQESIQPLQRRRRSERHGKRSNIHRRRRVRLTSLVEENENARYSYPAPPVHAREAFHEAVYPSADHNWESEKHDASK